MKNARHVATAAEAFAAGQLARCGWDVSVQSGANQPEYVFVAVNGDIVRHVRRAWAFSVDRLHALATGQGLR